MIFVVLKMGYVIPNILHLAPVNDILNSKFRHFFGFENILILLKKIECNM